MSPREIDMIIKPKVIPLFTIGVLILASCGSTAASAHPQDHVLKITLTNGATPGDANWQAVLTETPGGLDVTVANAAGTVIATGGPIFLGSPIRVKVPVESFYKITIGSLGTVTYSLAQVKSAGWTAAESVG